MTAPKRAQAIEHLRHSIEENREQAKWFEKLGETSYAEVLRRRVKVDEDWIRVWSEKA